MKILLVMGATLIVASLMLFQMQSPASRINSKINSYNTEEISVNKSASRRGLATDKTYYNKACADEGLDPTAGLFSSKDEDRYKNNRNKLIKGEDSVFKSLLIDEEQDKAVSTAISSFGLPIVLIIIFIVFSYPIGYLCYYCCACMPDRWCPPCKCCCKKCLCIQCSREEPYAGFSKLWPIVGMFVFLAWMAIAAIVGLAYTSGIEDSYKKFRCSTINFLYTVNAGQKTGEAKWGGMDNMLTVMENLDTNYNTLKANITTTLEGCNSGPLCITTEKGLLETSKTNLALNLASNTPTFKDKYNNDLDNTQIFSNVGVYVKNPQEGSADQGKSVFYGKTSTSAKSAYDTLVENLGTAGKSIVDEIEANLKGISDSRDSIVTGTGFQTAIQDGIEAIKEQQDFMNDQMESLYDTTQSPADYMKTLTMILNAIFGAFLGLSILVGVLGALMVAFNWYKVRIVLHLCWALFTLVTTISMIIALILFVISIIGFGGCDYVGYDVLKWDDPSGSTQSPEWTRLNNKIFKLTGKTKSIAEACFKSLGGNGDIFTPLGIKDQLKDLDTINDFSSQKSGFETTMAAVTTQINTVKQVFVDLFKNSQFNSLSDHPNLDTAISNANSHFQTSSLTPRFVSVYNSSVTLTSGNVDYQPFPANPGSVTFWIGDNWIDTAPLNKIDATDTYVTSTTGEKRLKKETNTSTVPASGNSTFNTAYGLKINPIMEWRDHKDAITINQLKKVFDYEDKFDAIKNKINIAFTSISNTLANIDDHIATVTDPTTGLLGTDNKCFFIGDGIDNTLKSFCWGFFPSLYLITESLIFIAVGMGMSSFFLCCTAMRYSKNLQLLNRKTNNDNTVKTAK